MMVLPEMFRGFSSDSDGLGRSFRGLRLSNLLRRLRSQQVNLNRRFRRLARRRVPLGRLHLDSCTAASRRRQENAHQQNERDQ